MAKARLTRVSVEDLQKEITRRQRKLPELIAARDTLSRLIAELESLGGLKPVAIRRRKAARSAMRPARPGSLSCALAAVLEAKGKMPIAEAADAVLAAGYKSKSKAFPKIVRMTLLKGKQFKRVARGVYALRG